MNDRVNKSKHNLDVFHLHEYHTKKGHIYICAPLLNDTSTCYLANPLYPQLVVFALFLPMVYSIKRTVWVIYMTESVNYWQFHQDYLTVCFQPPPHTHISIIQLLTQNILL